MDRSRQAPPWHWAKPWAPSQRGSGLLIQPAREPPAPRSGHEVPRKWRAQARTASASGPLVRMRLAARSGRRPR
jgi:hypothetical protein